MVTMMLNEFVARRERVLTNLRQTSCSQGINLSEPLLGIRDRGCGERDQEQEERHEKHLWIELEGG